MSVRATPQSLSTRPTVSVIIPCYNYGHYLSQCLGSVLSQDDVDLQVVIVDDASPDGSAAVAQQLAAADPRVRVIENGVNKGHITTFNVGLSTATGEYLVLLSADDMLAPGSLGRACALLEAHPEVAFVYGYVPDFSDEPPAANTTVRSWSVWSGPDWLRRTARRGHNVVSCPEVVMRTSVYRELGSYEHRLPHTSDFYMWMTAATRGSVGRVNGSDQAFYRVHGQNMHLEKFGGELTDMRERRKTYELLFAEHSDRIPDAAGLEAVVRSAMARDALIITRRAYDRWNTSTLAGAADLMEFAAETDAAIVHTRLWRACTRRQQRYKDGRRPTLAHRLVSAADDLGERVRWRRWRRTGI